VVSEHPGSTEPVQPPEEAGQGRAWSNGRGLRVLVLHGVPVYVSPVAVLFGVLVAVAAIPGYQERLPRLSDTGLDALGVALAALFLLSLLAHELAHCYTALAMSLSVDSVTVYGFAGFTEIHPEPPTPMREFLVAVAGPMANLVIGVVVLAARLPLATDGVASTLLYDVGRVNIALGILNLLPGLPLDGGRVTTSAVWGATHDRVKGTQAGALVGLALAGGFLLLGLATAASGAGVWWIVLSMFLGSGALQSLRQAKVRARVPDVTVRELLRRAVLVESDATPLGEALRRAQEQGAMGVVVVDGYGRPSAVMSGAAADAVPLARRPWVTLASVCRQVEDDMVLLAELGGDELLGRLAAAPASEYVVVDPAAADGGSPPVIGVLAAVDVAARLDPGAARRAASRRKPVAAR
jgi:Zn-dependent protease